MLVHSSDSDLSVIRRYMAVGDRANYVPDNPAYPEMLELDHGPRMSGAGFRGPAR